LEEGIAKVTEHHLLIVRPNGKLLGEYHFLDIKKIESKDPEVGRIPWNGFSSIIGFDFSCSNEGRT